MMDRDPNSALKVICSFLSGVVLCGLGAFITYPHDLVTKTDLANWQEQTQQQMTNLQTSMAANHSADAATEQAQQDELTKIRLQMARIDYKLGIPDQQ